MDATLRGRISRQPLNLKQYLLWWMVVAVYLHENYVLAWLPKKLLIFYRQFVVPAIKPDMTALTYSRNP